MKNLLQVNRALVAKKTFTNFKSDLTGMVREWYGNGSINSRLDSLSIVSRQSDLASSRQSDLAKYAAILLCVLMLGVGQMWGTDYSSTPLVSLDFSSSLPTVSGVTYHNATYSSGKISWSGNYSYGTRDVQITFTTTGSKFKLVLGHITSGSSMTFKYRLDSGSDTNLTLTKSATSDNYEISASAGTHTIALGPGGSSTRTVVTSIAIYDEAASCTNPTASWSTAPANGTAGGSMNASLTTNYATGVVYSSSNTSVATVSGNGTTTCAISYVAAGSARITATVTGDGSTICTDPATCYTDITVSAPSNTYYYRGADNSWGATAMTPSAGGTYEYYATTTNNHQFKIALSSDGWDYNYSYVDAGFYGTSISTIGDYSSDNCYVWSAPANYYIIVFKPNTAINTTSNPKICASATLPQDLFTISFVANGGSGSMSSITSLNAGATQVLPANAFTRSGYNFTGWKTNVAVTANGSAVAANGIVPNSASISNILSDITLTAQWELIPTYNVVYNANGGTGTTATQTGNLSGDQVTTSANGFTRSGYKFKWWNTAANGSGEDFYPGEKVTIASANVTLYAQWEDVPSGWEFWVGDNFTFATNVMSVGDMRITKTSSNVNSCEDLTNDNTIVSKYSSTNKHAKLLEINSNDKYIEISFSDGSPINSLKLWATTNQTSAKNLAIIYSTTADFSSGTYETKTVSVPANNAASKAMTDFSPATANTYLYARIYRKVNTAVYGFTGGSGNTARIYGIKAEKGVSCTTPAAPTNFTAGSISTTGATFTITDAANAASYDIYYSSSSTAPTTGSAATTTSTSKTKVVTDLTAGTTYYAWVRSVCDASHKSAWVALNPGGSTHTFTTNCVAPTDVTLSATVNSTSGYHFFPGDAVVLTATPTGSPAGSPVTYQWQKYNFATSAWSNVGTNSATYTIASATAGDAGRYRCTVTYGGSCATTSSVPFDLKCLQILLKTSGGADIGYYVPTRIGATSTASVAIELTGGTTYKFRVTDGCNNWYGNTGEMTSSNCTNWAMDANADCRVTTNTKTAYYTFKIDFSGGLLGTQMRVSVIYPGSNQEAGKVIFFDNNGVTWPANTIYYRIGRGTHNSVIKFTKVYGTANLFKITTAEYNDFEYWHIANNKGNVGNYSIDLTKSASYEIDHATSFQGANVTEAEITVTPSTSCEMGIRTNNDNCCFHPYSQMTGMKKDRVTISPYSNGTITVNYKDTSNVASNFTSGYQDLAHTVILTSITAVANPGYDASAITINGGAYSTNYVVTDVTTIAATFTPHVYTITYKDQGNKAFSGTHIDTPSAHPTEHTYATATTLNGATKAGYEFLGWYTTSDCSGDPISTIGATAYTTNITLYAKWAILYTVSFETNGGSSQSSISQVTHGSAITMPAAPTYADHTFQGWVIGGTTYAAGASYTPTADITAYALWQTACAGGADETIASVAVKSNYTMNDIVGSSAISGFDGSSRTQVGSTTEYANKLGSSGYVRISPKSGSSITAGDKIYIRIYNGKTSTKSINVALLQNDGSTKTQLPVTDIAASAVHEFEYTLTASEIFAAGYVQVMRGATNGDGGWFVAARIIHEGGGGSCYYVTYDGNGAESGLISDPTAYDAGSDVTVLGNTGTNRFIHAGYNFNGWNTAANGSGIAYAAGGKILGISANVTLYAQWQESSCTGVDAPTDLTCSAQTTSSLTFTWTKAANAVAYVATLYSNSGCTMQVEAQNLGDVATVTFSTGLTDNTTYYCRVQSKGDGTTYCLYGGTCTKVSGKTVAIPAYNVTHTLTNVVRSSGGEAGTGKAKQGQDYTVVFAASVGYSLPGAVTVTIGGATATAGTDYTWNPVTGTLTIPAANVTGNIVITIVGEELEGDGCEDLVNTEAATATTLSTTVGTATVNSPSSQTANSKAIKLNSSGYIELSPKAGKSFAAGDSLIVVIYNQASSAKTTGYKIANTDYTASIASKTNYTFRRKLIAADIVSSKVKIERSSSDGWFVSAIIKHCEELDACTTPILPTATLNDQTVCPGNDIAAWTATPTNASAISAAGESISYSWKKKGNNTELATTASYDLGSSATEGQAGTYVVTVTVSKTGFASRSVSAEIDLTVTAAVEEPSITADKATVYQGNSVTLTATCGTAGVTWQWYKCSDAAGTQTGSRLSTTNSYTLASAPAAGTYYYKAIATGTCGSAEHVYTLVVSAKSECENYYWFVYAADATANGVANNRDNFFGSSPKTGSSNQSTYKFTLDGTEYTATRNTGSSSFSISFAIPEGSTATMGINCKGSSSNPLYLTHSSGTPQKLVSNSSSAGAFVIEDITEGTWTLTSAGSWTLAGLGVKVCTTSTCSDAEPTISATNTTVCVGGTITLTATGYESSPTSIQWQKLNSGTSSWDNISGATSATYSVASAASTDAGSYRCVVTKGCARTSNTVTIAVPSAPVFNSFTTSRTVMQTIALSITDVEATDAVSYKWYKSADATWDSGDELIGETKNLTKAYDGEANGNPSYYVFCRATNSCGTTTSSAISIRVIAYVEEDCATRGAEGAAEFGFNSGGCSQGSYSETPCWYTTSRTKYLTYTAPDGKYMSKAKVTVAVTSGSKCAYAYSTDGGTTWTYANLTCNSTLAEKTITLPANINAFRIGRNLRDESDTEYGVTSGTFYLSKACFNYTESCTATSITVSPSTKTYTIGNTFTPSTFTVKHGSPATAFDPQPTLSYGSSDESVATVDDDGTVNFHKAGVVKITAFFTGGNIGGTEYCSSEKSYTITISCPDEAPTVQAAAGTNLGGCNNSIVLNAKMQDGTTDFSDGTFQWFRDGEVIAGATSSSYTVNRAGVYTVERTSVGGCTSPSSNKATIISDNTEPDVERLVPFQYYHKDKVYTAQMKMRHLFAVKHSGTKDGKNFDMTLSRNGDVATNVTSSNSFSVLQSADHSIDTVMIDLNRLSGKYAEGDELVLTCSAIDCQGNVSSTYKETITIYVIDDTPTLALICSGANGDGTRNTKNMVVGGDFLTGYNKADLCQQTGNTSFDKNTEWGLYTKLKVHYLVTPVNGYAPFNKLNYEPFDILFLTDYPKASKSDAAKDILDDMAALCDYRPLFSFKTHMVAKTPSKWAEKGFTTSPEVPKQSRLHLNIVCYAHPMFSTLKDKETNVIQFDYDDNSQIVYKMLSEAGYESSKGMQGFDIEAAENFVTIGVAHYDASYSDNYNNSGNIKWNSNSGDRMLVAAAERQTNIEARMILFSLNAGAHSKLTPTGDTVVLKCLEYLLDTDPIHVANCAFTFTNGVGNTHNATWYSNNCKSCTGTKGDGKWSTAANWGPDYIFVPTRNTETRVAAPCNVDIPNAEALSIRIIENGKLTIPSGSALNVMNTIKRMDGKELTPTEISDISIGSTAAGNGTLIFNNNSGDSKAGVAMYSKAVNDGTTATWQYIGVPHSDVTNAHRNYYDSWLYSWNPSSGWELVPNKGSVSPWTGYCITYPTAGYTYWMTGILAATSDQEISVPAGSYQVIGNSWTAPIDINSFTDDDMENLVKSIYFFNTGTDETGEGSVDTGDRWAPGTYVSVPIHAAPYTGDDHIPSLQGFYVTNSSGSAGTLHLNYSRHVRNTTRSSVVSGPMHAPKRAVRTENEPAVLKIFARGSHYDDRLIVLERTDFTRGNDDGWDGEKWDGSTISPTIWSINEENGAEAVTATPDMEGTIIGFRAGEDSEYRFDFVYDEEDETLYLLDTDNNTYTQVVTGSSYTFTCADKGEHNRFVLTRRAPQIATGVGGVQDDNDAKAVKFIKDDKLYIFMRGVLYDATGKVVK